MSDSNLNGPGAAGGDDVTRALRFLAKRAAAAGVSAAAHNGGLQLSIPCESGRETVAAISAMTWMFLRTKAWVTSLDGDPIRWQLTTRGRQQVRRQLSAEGAIAPAKTTRLRVPVAAHQSRPTIISMRVRLPG